MDGLWKRSFSFAFGCLQSVAMSTSDKVPSAATAMHTRTIAIRFTFAIALGVTALGCSSSDPKNGTLICGTGTHPCPEGYLCSQETNTCWKNGTLPSEDSGTTNADTHPAADAAIVPDVVPDVVGRDTMSGNDLSTDNVVPGDAPHDVAPMGQGLM
jgi:hypothetical protein